MELRHLRYFIAVAEEGSLTLAAERRLHTAQPSLSRQIRDLEIEVGVQLMTRSARGTELTAAGRAFLDHARLALAQVEAAAEAARRAAQPSKASLIIGFLTGQEMQWLPEAMHVLRDELPNIDIVISSQTSPELALSLMRGKADIGFMRPEQGMPELEFKLLTKEPIVAVLPRDHPLAAAESVDPRDIAGETVIGVSETAPVLRIVIDDYFKTAGIVLIQDHQADNLSMAISLVASTGGVALLPSYARYLLPASVVMRPLCGVALTVDLVLGYRRGSASPLLKLFLSRVDDLIARVSLNA